MEKELIRNDEEAIQFQRAHMGICCGCDKEMPIDYPCVAVAFYQDNGEDEYTFIEYVYKDDFE